MRALPFAGAEGVRGAAAAFGWRRLLLSAAVLLGSAFAGYQAYQRFAPRPAAPPALQTAPAARRTLVERVSLPGTVGAARQARLSYAAASTGVSVSGKVQSIAVRTGDGVQAGQELARLDTTNLDLAVLSARNALETARLRMRQLLDGALPADVAAAEQAVLSAAAALETAKTNLVNAQSALDALQGRMDAAAQAAALQRSLDALRAQSTTAQTEVNVVLDRLTAAGGFGAGARSALNDLSSALRVRCDAVTNRDRCAALAVSATDLRGLVTAIDSGTPAIPFDLAAPLAQFERSAPPADVDALRVPAFRLLQAAAAMPGLAAQANSLTLSLSGAAGIPSADALANAVRARDSAASALDAARASLQAATARRDQTLAGPLPVEIALQEQSIAQADITLRRAVNDQQGAVLLAPFDGVVGAITMNVGEPSGTGAMILIDPLSMQLNATSQESDVGRLKVGQTVNLTFDALAGFTVAGRVATIAPAADVQQGVASYAVVVEVTRTPARLDLRAGMTGTAAVEITRHDNVLAVPSRAVRRQGRNQVVEVLVGDAREMRTVRTGATDGSYTEITGGLAEGDTIVIPVATTTTSATTGGGGFPGGGAAPAPPPGAR